MELLIVIGVIGILASVLIAVLNPIRQINKARDSQRKNDLKQVQQALEQYYSDFENYPTISCFSSNTLCWSVVNGASNLLGANASNYIKKMPVDPKTSGSDCTSASSYGYKYVASGGTSYTLVTRLENTSDSQIQTGPIAGCNSVFNYSLTNQQ